MRRVAGRGEALELVGSKADPDLSVEDAHRCRNRTLFADPPLGLERDVETLAGGEAVRDERRLERDDGPSGVDGVAHLGGEFDHGVAPRFDTHRAAVSSASSTPPTR